MKTKYPILAILLLLAGLASVAAPEGAIAGDRSQHCVMTSDKGGAQPAAPACFDTLSDAIFAATEGRVRLDRGVRPSEVTDQMLGQEETQPRVPEPDANTVVLGILFRNAGFLGGTLVLTASSEGLGCRSGNTYAFSRLPKGWNDEMGSIKNFSDCTRSILYEDINFRGVQLTCREYCSGVRKLDDEVSSIRFYRYVAPSP